MKIQNLIENTNNSMTNQNETLHGKFIKKDLQEKRVFRTDRVKTRTLNEENKPKARNKSRRSHMGSSSISTWRSSPSLNLFDMKFEDAKIDLDKIENDLN